MLLVRNFERIGGQPNCCRSSQHSLKLMPSSLSAGYFNCSPAGPVGGGTTGGPFEEGSGTLISAASLDNTAAAQSDCMFCAIPAVISILGAALEAGSLPEGSSVSNDRLCTARCSVAVEVDISTLADSPFTVVELQCDPALPAVGADISTGVATAVGADLSTVVLSAALKT
jgi:hypothetical protein